MKILQTTELTNEKFHNREGRRHLTKPKQKHPLDDLGLDFRTICLCHETLREVVLLLPESYFKTLSYGSGYWRLDISSLQNTENFCGAHKVSSKKSTSQYPRQFTIQLRNLGSVLGSFSPILSILGGLALSQAEVSST